jgi:hypothetical protein
MRVWASTCITELGGVLAVRLSICRLGIGTLRAERQYSNHTDIATIITEWRAFRYLKKTPILVDGVLASPDAIIPLSLQQALA